MQTNQPISYWVDDLSPFVVRFTDSVGIRYYGLAYVLVFVIAALLLRLYWRKGRSSLDPKVQSDLIMAFIVGVMVGGRLGYFLLYSPMTLLREPLALFRIWDGGMASYGGFVGVCLALIWLVRKHKLPWRAVADALVTLAPPGLFLGRVANFIKGELWGKVSHVPGAVIFPKSSPAGTPLAEIPPRHPSQLYEASLEGLLLMIYTQLRFWRSNVTHERPGRLAGEFLMLYAVVRAIGETFREPDASLLFGVVARFIRCSWPLEGRFFMKQAVADPMRPPRTTTKLPESIVSAMRNDISTERNRPLNNRNLPKVGWRVFRYDRTVRPSLNLGQQSYV